MNPRIERLVKSKLVFHGLNKSIEFDLGLNLIQFYLLNAIKDHPACSPQYLAEEVEVRPSTLTLSLKRLKRKGAIFIDEDPRDSRKRIIGLTKKGWIRLRKFDQVIEDRMM